MTFNRNEQAARELKLKLEHAKTLMAQTKNYEICPRAYEGCFGAKDSRQFAKACSISEVSVNCKFYLEMASGIIDIERGGYSK